MATRNDTHEPINKATEAGRNATEEAARTTDTVTHEAAEVGERTARLALTWLAEARRRPTKPCRRVQHRGSELSALDGSGHPGAGLCRPASRGVGPPLV